MGWDYCRELFALVLLGGREVEEWEGGGRGGREKGGVGMLLDAVGWWLLWGSLC